MQLTCYLVVQGVRVNNFSSVRKAGSIQVRKAKPGTNHDELAIRLAIDIPDSLFEKPTLSVTASVPPETGSGPEITAEVQESIADLIRSQLGVNVHITTTSEDD